MNLNKIKYLFFLLILMVVGVFNVKAFDKSIKLYDNADIYSNDEEKALRQKIKGYIDKYDMDLVVVTTSINTYSDTETFEAKFYQDNGFGFTGKKNGTILAIDLDNNLYEFISYGEMQRYLDDTRIDAIYDYVDKAYLNSDKDYYVLANSFIDRLDYYVEKGIPSSNIDTYISSDGVLHARHTFPYIVVILISLGISIVVVFIFAFKTKMIKRSVEANNYIDKDKSSISKRNDMFVTTYTTKTKIVRSDNSGGGSHSSGHGGRSL